MCREKVSFARWIPICIIAVCFFSFEMYSDVSPITFCKDSEFESYPSPYLHPTRIGSIYFNCALEEEDIIYIMPSWWDASFLTEEYSIITFSELSVAYIK